MADKAHRLTDEKLEEMEKRLSAIYSRAEKEIGERWKEYLSEAQAEIDELQKAYDIAKKGGDPKEIRKAGIKLSRAKRDRTLMNNRFKDLTERTAAELANVNKTALAYINGQLPEVYSINYNVLAPTVDGVGGYSFALVDEDTVKHLATTDKSLLPYKQLDEKKDIRWNVKKMNAEVLQGIVQGEPMDRIASRLSKVIGMDETAAIRNARTMVTGAENKGRQDSYARAEADGIILQKEWLSSDQPGRTRDWHMPSAFTSLIVDQDKPFENSLGKIMFPGDPSAHGANVWNCRCSMAAVVKGFKKAQVQKAMAEKQEQTQEQTIKKPEDYTDSASIDKRLAELQKEMDSSNDFSRWVEIEKEQAALAERKKLLLKKESEARATETQRRIYEKDYFATKGMGKGYAVDLDGVDEKSMLAVEKALDSVFGQFPGLKNKFVGISFVDSWSENTMAGCESRFGQVLLSKKYFSDYSVLANAMDRCVSVGFHPANTEPYSIVVHEFGHAIDHLITRKGDMFDPKYIGKDATASTAIKKSVYKKLGISDGDVASGLSSYATMNDKEFVAEAFAEYVTSPTPRPIAVAVGEEIENMLGGFL